MRRFGDSTCGRQGDPAPRTATWSARPAVPMWSIAGLLLAWLLAGLLIPSLVRSARADAEVNPDVPRSPFVAVGRAVRPAVVSLRIVRAVDSRGVDTSPLQEMFRRFFPDKEGEGGRFENPGTGSGFVIAGSGDVLTNHHVIAGADRIFVRFPGEAQEYAAELVGSDPSTDLALVRIDPAGRDLPVLEFGESEQLEVGDWAIAIGNPFGNLEGSLTVGVVSAEGRGDLVIQGLTPRYQDFIQTDASINFGNSGGPLVDIHGRVIGVNTAINARGQGIGFAVPSRIVRRIYAELAEHGRVVRGYLGVRSRDLTAAEIEGGAGAGVRVLDVVAASPAAAAGVEAGDIIVSLGGQPVSDRRDLDFLVADAPVGEPVSVEIVREGKTLALPVELTELTADAATGDAERRHWLGLEVASLAEPDSRVDRIKETLGITATDGVIVVSVQRDQPAAEAGIRPGDVLVAIEGQEIPDLLAYERIRDSLRQQRDPLTVLVRTGTQENYVQVTPRDPGSVQ